MLQKGKIVIIDDDLEDAALLKDKLKLYLDDEVYIFDFFNSEFLKTEVIDLLFLDIELNDHVNGIDEAVKIRDEQNYKMNIVFVSRFNGLVHNSMPAMPIYFIRKEKLDKDLKTAFETLERNHFRIRQSIQTRARQVCLDDVMYIESLRNDILIYVADGSVTKERSTLNNYEKELSNKYFIRCHNSYIVNIKYIRNKINDTLIMKNGIRIKITEKYLKSFNEFYRNYFLKY